MSDRDADGHDVRAVRCYGKIQSSDAARITARTHLWISWLQIAIGQECLARKAREVELSEVALSKEGSSFGLSAALNDELHASMIAVLAVAHALDALYGALRIDIPVPQAVREGWKKNKTARSTVILETLKQGFAIGKHGQLWHEDICWLFKHRDQAVHFEEGNRDLLPHPAGTNVAPEHVYYSLEAVERALNLAMDILDTCSKAPRTNIKPVTTWARDMRPAIALLADQRCSADG